MTNLNNEERKQKKSQIHADYWRKTLKHQRVMCPECKTTYNITHKSHHIKTKKHLNNLNAPQHPQLPLPCLLPEHVFLLQHHLPAMFPTD